MTLDPRHLPRSFPEMLQDLIAMHEKIKLYDDTRAKQIAFVMVPAVCLAIEQLRKIEQAAVKRMVQP